jgi:hypothetical protein
MYKRFATTKNSNTINPQVNHQDHGQWTTKQKYKFTSNFGGWQVSNEWKKDVFYSPNGCSFKFITPTNFFA